MPTHRLALALLVLACASSLLATERPADEDVFAAALEGVKQQLYAAPPLNLEHKSDSWKLPADSIVVARRTIGGAPLGLQKFLDKTFGKVIAEELSASYGNGGPASRNIEQPKAGDFPVLDLDEFENGAYDYDWARLNAKYPAVRHVVRISWPAVDRLGTYGVVRYELIGRDRPPTATHSPWQHASFVAFEKRENGSWKRTLSIIGAIWK